MDSANFMNAKVDIWGFMNVNPRHIKTSNEFPSNGNRKTMENYSSNFLGVSQASSFSLPLPPVVSWTASLSKPQLVARLQRPPALATGLEKGASKMSM